VGLQDHLGAELGGIGRECGGGEDDLTVQDDLGIANSHGLDDHHIDAGFGQEMMGEYLGGASGTLERSEC